MLLIKNKPVENPGVDPGISRMLSGALQFEIIPRGSD